MTVHIDYTMYLMGVVSHYEIIAKHGNKWLNEQEKIFNNKGDI